jgi:hypothetical protein
VEKSSKNFWDTSSIFKKLPKENNHPRGEKLPKNNYHPRGEKSPKAKNRPRGEKSPNLATRGSSHAI